MIAGVIRAYAYFDGSEQTYLKPPVARGARRAGADAGGRATALVSIYRGLGSGWSDAAAPAIASN